VNHFADGERGTVHETDGALGRVTDECCAGTEALDAPRVRQAFDRADEPTGENVDHGEPRVGIAGRKRKHGYRGTSRLGAEEDRGGGKTEKTATVH
jgi:hypothetical protein